MMDCTNKRMHTKRLTGIAIVGVLALSLAALAGLAGCGASSGGGKTTVTLTTSEEVPGFEKAFEAANPDIDLQVEYLATGVINGEVNRRLKNNHGSDLIVTSLPAGEVAQYTMDLSAQSFVENYQSGITSTLTVDGQNRYLPLPGSYYGYIINKSLLDELGLGIPTTKAELLNVLATAKEKGVGVTSEGYGFGLADIGANFVGSYFIGDYATDFLSTTEGAKWLSGFKDGTSTFSGSWNTAADFLKSIVDGGYADPKKMMVNYGVNVLSVNAFKPEVNMADRTAIVTYGNLLTYEDVTSASTDEFVMVPCLPAGSDGNTLVSAVSNNYIAVNNAIASDKAKTDAACKVLDFLSTEEGQKAWMEDTSCPYSYLNGFKTDTSSLPAGIRTYVDNGAVYTSPFQTDLVSYIGLTLGNVVLGKTGIDDALAAIDDYRVNGSDQVAYDMSVVGTVAEDMLYENSNTRKEETQLGNLVSDALLELTGADVALVNGGGIRSSLYKGDVTGSDLTAVCPYDNLIIVVEMDGATLRSAVTNGIQKTWKPAGQFLQVSGIKYAYKPAADATETAELTKLTYEDGTEVKDSDVITVAYTNYMGGSQGYVDAGDGFTMLNVYDSATPVTVKLKTETGKTYCDALKEYFANHANEQITSPLEGRITIEK